MKKTFLAVISLILVLSIFTGCNAKAAIVKDDTPKIGLPNPMVSCQSADEMNSVVGCNIKSALDSYVNVTEEAFDVIHTETPIAQYKFLLDTIPVCIRAAISMDDISGIFMPDEKHPSDLLTEDNPYAVIDTGYGLFTRWFIGGMQYCIVVGNETFDSSALTGDYASLEDDVLMLRDFETYTSFPWYVDDVQDMNEFGNVLTYRSEIQNWNRTNGKSFGTGADFPYASLKNAVPEERVNTVHVSDIDAFLKAIAPDTEIQLDPGFYFLTDAADYGTGSSKYYHWEETYDGYELVIENTNNLSIRGSFSELDDGSIALDTAFITSPRYSSIIRFRRCDNLSISSSVFGHTEQGECMGAVLSFEICKNTVINGCELYGCGVTGIEGLNCQNMNVNDAIIHDCSYMHTDLNSCKDITFTKCSFLLNSGYGGASMYGCNNITFEDCDFAYNYVNQIFNAEATDTVNIKNCFILYNETGAGIFNGDGNAFEVSGGACVEYSMEEGQYSEIAFG